MQHSSVTSPRAAIYQWFSQLLFQELTEAQLVTLGSRESRAWIASLSTIPGLASDVKRFERSLTRVLHREARAQELAADFASLFLLAPPVGVSPYAGHYPHTTPAQERRQMNALLVEQALAPRENEASDHIAIQLALMAEQISREASVATQYYFLQHHILCWAPLFMASCQQREAEGFYVLAVAMIVHFMHEDAQYLESLLMDNVYCRNH
ncbi:molecular chaperone TorD [Salmonella bongori]|uniref:Chaperone protein TorD n=1 Tax=Salmonella bongori N268-08 TaxID=1197719 RepID=S5MY60_SALBN|nr:molecular chaperone TorD [Salmonella bongori]EGE4655182.1 molecular chaperone TorD [Salmonella bongori serovar 40:z35:- str. 95-0123]EGE4659750.1 molecular chaperone TorD [Salmonella bongori serovar 48:i:- str. 94-0708]AGR59524.1 Chaperone protein TorD [Salmonella bongori N268-08]ECC8732482.1 molecular chaperone TorD [Salmonella bongori]ECC8922786.1 molecular chaperone TorD [Salmonella bongori]